MTVKTRSELLAAITPLIPSSWTDQQLTDFIDSVTLSSELDEAIETLEDMISANVPETRGIFMSTNVEHEQAIPHGVETFLDLSNLDIDYEFTDGQGSFFDMGEPDHLTVPFSGIFDIKMHFQIEKMSANPYYYRSLFTVNGGGGSARAKGLAGETQLPGLVDANVGIYEYNSTRLILEAGDEVAFTVFYQMQTGSSTDLGFYLKDASIMYDGPRHSN